MINLLAELQAWQAEFPDLTGWEIRLGKFVIVTASDPSVDGWDKTGLAEVYEAATYDRQSAFKDAREWLNYWRAYRSECHAVQ